MSIEFLETFYRSEVDFAGDGRTINLVMHYCLADKQHPLLVSVYEVTSLGTVINISDALQFSEKEWGSIVIEVSNFLQEVDADRIKRVQDAG